MSRCAPKARKNVWFYSDKPRKIDIFGDHFFIFVEIFCIETFMSRCAPKARKIFWFYSDKPRKIDVFGDNYFNRFYDKSGFFMTNGNFPKFYDVWQPWKSGPGCVAALETTQKIKMLIRSYTPRKIFGIFTHIFKDFTFRQTSKTYAPKC